MIEVENLSKIYASTTAIEDVSFAVEAGEIVGFLGPNGAGKTTTMRILSGFLPATSGTAKVAGYDVHKKSMEVRRRIGYLPENPPLYLEMTVESFLDFVARIKGVNAGDRSTKINSAIERCQLSEKRQTPIRKLSKGYRQRVGIAQAIVHDPPAIILDEPTVGLDPRQIIEVRNLIKSLAGDHTIILSTHILPEVSMTCDRIVIINRGKVIATDKPENLMTQLTGNSGYSVEIAGNLENLASLFSNIPGVLKVEVNSREDRCLLQITTAADTEPGNEIAKMAIDSDLELYEMRRTRPSLEDVFLELTTKDIMVNEHQELEINNDQ